MRDCHPQFTIGETEAQSTEQYVKGDSGNLQWSCELNCHLFCPKLLSHLLVQALSCTEPGRSNNSLAMGPFKGDSMFSSCPRSRLGFRHSPPTGWDWRYLEQHMPPGVPVHLWWLGRLRYWQISAHSFLLSTHAHRECSCPSKAALLSVLLSMVMMTDLTYAPLLLCRMDWSVCRWPLLALLCTRLRSHASSLAGLPRTLAQQPEDSSAARHVGLHPMCSCTNRGHQH